jgi:rod shape-determining protein MreD
VTPARKAVTAVTLAVALFAAVVVQLTVVNRLPLPGGSGPDLVLLLVTAIAVVTTPALAAVTGFASGLAVDVAPPAAHYAGEYALVFCLAGYGAARVNRAIANITGEHDPVTAFTVMAVAAAAGEAGKAALGMLLSAPDVTTAGVSRVLPVAILYDLLLSPLVFWLVARVTRGAVAWSTGPERAPGPQFSPEQRLASVFRQASTGAAPSLHLAGSGTAYGPPAAPRRLPSLRFAGSGKDYAAMPAAGRIPKLRFSGARSAAALRTVPGSPGGPRSPLPAGSARKVNFAGDLPARTGTRPVRTPGKNWLRAGSAPALGIAKRPARGPSRGWLAAAGADGLISQGGKTSRRKRARPRGFGTGAFGAGRASAPIAPQLPRTAAEALAARSAPSGLSALAGAGTPLAGGRSPQAGWLSGGRGAPAPIVRRSPRSGWLGSARRRPRTVIGSGVGGRAVIGSSRNWYTASPSGAWLRRSKHPWRRRSQRLLRMMGVTK